MRGVLQMKMISSHPTIPGKYVINFDLKYKFEEDYQIDIVRSDPENPPSGIDLDNLTHIASAIDLMLAKLRFEISLYRVQKDIYKHE